MRSSTAELGDDGIQLVISWAYGQLRVEVHDRCKSGPVLVEAPCDAEAGRGLLLLASLCTNWGWRKRSPARPSTSRSRPEN